MLGARGYGNRGVCALVRETMVGVATIRSDEGEDEDLGRNGETTSSSFQ